MDLLPAIFLNGGCGIPLCLRHYQVAQHHGDKPFFLASRLGVLGLLGAPDIADRSGVSTAVVRRDIRDSM